jgi:hypothetical protein
MNVPYQGIVVGSNEVFKKVVKRNKIELNGGIYFICAGISGLIGSLLTMPLDNVRTRMNTQCDLVQAKACAEKIECVCTKERGGAIKYKNTWVTASQIYVQEGVRGFYKGLLPRAATQSFASAISWTTYELIKKMMSRNTQAK